MSGKMGRTEQRERARARESQSWGRGALEGKREINEVDGERSEGQSLKKKKK